MKMKNNILKMFRYFYLICVIAFGLMAIIGSGGGGGDGGGTSGGGTTEETTTEETSDNNQFGKAIFGQATFQ